MNTNSKINEIIKKCNYYQNIKGRVALYALHVDQFDDELSDICKNIQVYRGTDIPSNDSRLQFSYIYNPTTVQTYGYTDLTKNNYENIYADGVNDYNSKYGTDHNYTYNLPNELIEPFDNSNNILYTFLIIVCIYICYKYVIHITNYK